MWTNSNIHSFIKEGRKKRKVKQTNEEMEEEQSRQQNVSFKMMYLIHLEYAA